MRTGLDQTTILYKAINASPLKPAINGDIYRDERPSNSNKQDIVVNAITLEGSESVIQRGVGNVNIHLPNLANGLPDHTKFKALSDIAVTTLKDYVNGDYNFWIDAAPQLVKDLSSGKYYLNIRIKFKFHNTI